MLPTMTSMTQQVVFAVAALLILLWPAVNLSQRTWAFLAAVFLLIAQFGVVALSAAVVSALTFLIYWVAKRLFPDWIPEQAPILSPPSKPTDKTREPKATGTDVVVATVDQIAGSGIFRDDKMLLRLAALIVTNDGETIKGNGGIWQIEKAWFDRMKVEAPKKIGDTVKAIEEKFQLEWQVLVYDDMQIPIVCALFARIWIDIQLSMTPNASISWDRSKQEEFIKTIWPTDSNQVVPRETAAPKTQTADVLFVLDSSGSVCDADFDLMKKFIKDMVESFKVGPNEVRVGVIRYSDSSELLFGLEEHTNPSDLVKAIGAVKHVGGITATHKALEDAMKEFESSPRAEDWVPQICIVMTDGESQQPNVTYAAAAKLHELNITVFTIGVGKDVNKQELREIASKPYHSHVFTLETFAEMDPFKIRLATHVARAAANLDPEKPASGRLTKGSYVYFQVRAKRQYGGITIWLRMTEGGGLLFGSYTNRYPNTANHDFSLLEVNASDDGKKGKSLYIPFRDDPKAGEELQVFLSLTGASDEGEDFYEIEYANGVPDLDYRPAPSPAEPTKKPSGRRNSIMKPGPTLDPETGFWSGWAEHSRFFSSRTPDFSSFVDESRTKFRKMKENWTVHWYDK